MELKHCLFQKRTYKINLYKEFMYYDDSDLKVEFVKLKIIHWYYKLFKPF